MSLIKSQACFFPSLAGLLEDQVEKLVEVFQSFCGIRRPGQGMGELLDQHGGESQLLLIGGIEQLLPVAVADVKAVV